MLRSQTVRIVLGAASAALLVVAVPRAADALHHGVHVKIASPRKGAKVTSPVTVIAKVEDFKLVAAGTPLADGEGHLHFFIDVPANNVKPGAMIPLDTLTRYLHLGKEPFDRREITLAPGKHTITVVAANSGHQRLKDVKPYSVTFTVTK